MHGYNQLAYQFWKTLLPLEKVNLIRLEYVTNLIQRQIFKTANFWYSERKPEIPLVQILQNT